MRPYRPVTLIRPQGLGELPAFIAPYMDDIAADAKVRYLPAIEDEIAARVRVEAQAAVKPWIVASLLASALALLLAVRAGRRA